MRKSFTGALGDIYTVHTDQVGVERVVYRILPIRRNSVYAAEHSEYASYGSAVAIGVKARFDRHTDGAGVVAFTVQKRGGNDHCV